MAKGRSSKLMKELPHSIVSVLVVFVACLALFAGYWGIRKLLRDGFLVGTAPKSCQAGGETAVDPSAAVCDCA
jgi:hypothetical protein